MEETRIKNLRGPEHRRGRQAAVQRDVIAAAEQAGLHEVVRHMKETLKL